MSLPVIVAVPAALSLNALRNALHAAHLPATVAPTGRDGVKVTPGKGIDRRQVETFVKGFIAGFNA